MRPSSALLLALALVIGCGPASTPTPPPPVPTPLLRLAVADDARLLVHRWSGALLRGEDFQVSVEPGADDVAYDALLGGRAVAAIAHRVASEAEDRRARGDDLVPGEGLQYLDLAWAPITLLVQADNPVRAVTREQARGLLSGAINSWSEVGGAPIAVERFWREKNTATMATARRWLDGPEPAPGQPLATAEAVATAVAAAPGGLGLGGGASKTGVRPLAIRMPDRSLVVPGASLENGARWPIQRPLILVWRGAREPRLDRWLERVTGPGGAGIAEREGYRLTPQAP